MVQQLPQLPLPHKDSSSDHVLQNKEDENRVERPRLGTPVLERLLLLVFLVVARFPSSAEKSTTDTLATDSTCRKHLAVDRRTSRAHRWNSGRTTYWYIIWLKSFCSNALEHKGRSYCQISSTSPDTRLRLASFFPFILPAVFLLSIRSIYRFTDVKACEAKLLLIGKHLYSWCPFFPAEVEINEWCQWW